MPINNRKWNVVEMLSPTLMAIEIVKNNWCLCVGFRCQGILWLNDSMTPDSVPEWSVVRERDGRQCETISLWGGKSETIVEIAKIQKRFKGGEKPMFGEGQMIEPGDLEHPEDCRLCA
jgi:hypothetical protein